MLPIEPEPMEKLKERFPAALDPIYLVPMVVAGHLPRPGTQRKHVFDFDNGFRMIASVEREKFDSDIVLHLSFSTNKIPANITSEPDLVGYCHHLAKEVTGGKFCVAQVMRSDAAVHLVYNVNELFEAQLPPKPAAHRKSAWTSPLHRD